jgi:ABC-type transporter Mla subunit MlaD
VAKARRSRSTRARRHDQPAGNRLFDDALSLASTLADSRKRAGADRIVELASATREFSASLDDFPQLRRYSNAAAQNLDDLADYIVRTDIPDMLDDLARFAKRQPVATLTLGVAAGLAFTQLMHDWPIRMRARRTSSNGHGKRRSGRRRTAH